MCLAFYILLPFGRVNKFITTFANQKFLKQFSTFIMGRGDVKTKKGKIFKGSFGKIRPAKLVKKTATKKES